MCHAVVMLITSYNQPDFPPPHIHLRNGVQEGEEEPGWFRQVSTSAQATSVGMNEARAAWIQPETETYNKKS